MSTRRRNIEGKLAMLGLGPQLCILFTTCLEASQTPLVFSVTVLRIVAQPDPAYDRSPCNAGEEENERPIQGTRRCWIMYVYTIGSKTNSCGRQPGVCGDKETVWK